jgi:flagellar basal-body rod protein FlgB
MAVDMKFRPSTQQSLDGNTVESDQEIIRLTDNNIRYQYSLSYASKKLETIKSILKDI